MSVVFFHFDPQQEFDREFLKSLGNHRFGIVSDQSPDEVKAALQQNNVDDLFQYIVPSSDGNWCESAASQASVAAQDIVYVDPNRAKLARAEAYGIRGVVDSSRLPVLAKQAAINIGGLADCMTDAENAALDNDPGPGNETNFDHMLARLDAAKVRLPALYLTRAHQPFVSSLTSLGSSGFTDVLVTEAETTGVLLLDISQSILQNGEKYQDTATDAFEEVVTDLYDGFLSAEDRKGIKAPDRDVLPPLVKWGNPNDGPYTWPSDATRTFGVECGVVNLPPSNATAGVMAWAALAHETAGHDILHADHGLEAELAQAVHDRLQPLGAGLASYWSQRIDETASDVMGILNMGPAPAIGLVAYFRALNAAFGNGPHLRTTGDADDPHPADILRGYLAAATVNQLNFTASAAWAKVINAETDKDATPTFNVGGMTVSKAAGRKSAQIVAETIATFKSQVLKNHALIEIQDWSDNDEATVGSLIPALTTAAALPAAITGAGVFAAHVVAASVVAALAKKAAPAAIFKRMISTLKSLHDSNPAWGPMHVLHPSTVYRDYAYIR